LPERFEGSHAHHGPGRAEGGRSPSGTGGFDEGARRPVQSATEREDEIVEEGADARADDDLVGGEAYAPRILQEGRHGLRELRHRLDRLQGAGEQAFEEGEGDAVDVVLEVEAKESRVVVAEEAWREGRRLGGLRDAA